MWADLYLENTSHLKFRNNVELSRVVVETLKTDRKHEMKQVM
jgi:hypothetical protein